MKIIWYMDKYGTLRPFEFEFEVYVADALCSYVPAVGDKVRIPVMHKRGYKTGNETGTVSKVLEGDWPGYVRAFVTPDSRPGLPMKPVEAPRGTRS